MTLDQIAELWLLEKTQAEIAREISTTPSAVAGIVSRARETGDARFAPRPPPIREPRAKIRKLKPVGETVGNERPRPAPPAPVRPDGFLLVEMHHRQCRYATNNAPKGELHRFCGAPTARPPYCEKHRAALVRAQEAAH
jgi:hypothetical protein